VTGVRFYHNSADPLALACELISRARASGRRIVVRLNDANSVQRLDQLLWEMDRNSFIPHVTVDSPLVNETPIVLGQADRTSAWPHHDLLFNLADNVPPDFTEFRHVVEIVGLSDAQRQPARARWTHYKRLGHPLKAFDAEKREAIA